MLHTSNGEVILLIASFLIIRTSLKGKNLLPVEFAHTGSKFFTLRAVSFGVEITFTSFECYIFITHVRNLRNGSYANVGTV